MTVRDFDGGVLAPPSEFKTAPPPAADLLKAVGAMKPVPTRTRFGAFVLVGLVGLIWPAIALGHLPLRRDLSALPTWWVVTAASLWGLAFALSLAAALVPRRGDVLPAPGRASRASGAAMAVLLVFVLVATAQAPGVSVRPEDLHWTLLRSCVHCASFVLEISAVFLVIGLLALRRLVPVGGSRIGMALGAAGGAMGGLVLHFICPIADTGHVALAHVGGMGLAAAIGALLLSGGGRR
jgi:hypothetical protein